MEPSEQNFESVLARFAAATEQMAQAAGEPSLRRLAALLDERNEALRALLNTEPDSLGDLTPDERERLARLGEEALVRVKGVRAVLMGQIEELRAARRHLRALNPARTRASRRIDIRL